MASITKSGISTLTKHTNINLSFLSISSYIFQLIAFMKCKDTAMPCPYGDLSIAQCTYLKKKLPSGRKAKGRKPFISSTTMYLTPIMARAIAPRIYLMAESICTAAKYFELLFLDSCKIGRLILNPVRGCLQLSV